MCHLIFSIKIDFTGIACILASIARAETPTSLIYSSIVSKNNINLAFIFEVFNDLGIWHVTLEILSQAILFEAGIKHGVHEGRGLSNGHSPCSLWT
ncbi:hypothetical protein ACHAXS_008306 [Conticribra weissflogii]